MTRRRSSKAEDIETTEAPEPKVHSTPVGTRVLYTLTHGDCLALGDRARVKGGTINGYRPGYEVAADVVRAGHVGEEELEVVNLKALIDGSESELWLVNILASESGDAEEGRCRPLPSR